MADKNKPFIGLVNLSFLVNFLELTQVSAEMLGLGFLLKNKMKPDR